MLMPPISRYMTRQPWTIAPHATMTEAHRLMRAHQIRHLPVLEGGTLVGVVSERDLHLIETLPDADPDEVEVAEAMTEAVFTATPDDEVANTVQRMADKKLGSVVVIGKQGVEGIFTSIDAMSALSDLLKRVTA